MGAPIFRTAFCLALSMLIQIVDKRHKDAGERNGSRAIQKRGKPISSLATQSEMEGCISNRARFVGMLRLMRITTIIANP